MKRAIALTFLVVLVLVFLPAVLGFFLEHATAAYHFYASLFPDDRQGQAAAKGTLLLAPVVLFCLAFN